MEALALVFCIVLPAICLPLAGYAFWEAMFHNKNVIRISRGLPRRQHRYEWQRDLCDWMTRKTTGNMEVR